jgi:hypothetical protein
VKNGTFESRQAIVKINRLEKLLIEKGIVSGVELQDAELTCREEEIKEHQRIETDFWNKIQPGMEVQQDGSFDRKRFTGTVISKTEKPFQALVIQITQKTRDFKRGQIYTETYFPNLSVMTMPQGTWESLQR